MPNLLPVFVGLVVAASLLPLGVTSQATGVEYTLFIDCPTTRGISLNSNAVGCPVRATDEADIMGDPSLAVDPLAPENLIIASLHGRADCPGAPQVKSRCGQAFTTFTSIDHGGSWQDNPFTPPDDVAGAWGEHPQITIDPYGRAYVGSLYSLPRADEGSFEYVIAAQKFSSLQTINAEQDGEYNVEYIPSLHAGSAIGQMWFLFNPITDNMTMVWHEQATPFSEPKDLTAPPTCVPRKSPTAQPSSSSSGSSSSSSSSSSTTSSTSTSTSSPTSGSSSSSSSSSSTSSTGTSTSTSTSSPTSGSSTSSSTSTSSPTSSSTSTTGVLRWPLQAAAPGLALEAVAGTPTADGTATQNAAQAQPNDEAPARSLIGVVWTGPQYGSCYQNQPYQWAIGPCLKSTNPVLSEGWLYVGCVSRTDEGPFPYNPDTIPGTVEMFRMHPDGGEPQYLGASPIIGGNPKLGVRSDARIALATTMATEDGRLDFNVAFGQYDPASASMYWGKVRAMGPQVEKVTPGLRILESNIQDMLYREHSGVLHLVLKERVETTGLGAQAVTGVTAPELRKFIVAIDETYGVLAKIGLDVGNILNRTDTTLLQANEAAFNDLSDDFLQLPRQDVYEYTEPISGLTYRLENYQREFFAVGDYGTVLFAEVVEVTNLRGPAFPSVQPTVLPQPAPAVATATTPATVPAAGLTMAGALSLALLASKRKTAVLTRARK